LSIDENVGQYMISADADKLSEHVFRNLIGNAIAYTIKGSVVVSLSKDSSGKIIFSVKDTGVGINDEDKKRLFTEGGHGKDSIKVNAHSTGYGLYIAKSIIEAHKGTVHAQSDGTGKGSQFIAEFPSA
ncbi:MAG TPA: HAMP domain-containing histidine kinase, partial [Candidatus Kaiserbacteria bacterium]|nr:HAMP domain-containing histidine kinase [Candidatus Kaiserbacteria bacterium]